MRKKIGLIALLVASAAAMVSPALAHDRNDRNYNYNYNSGYSNGYSNEYANGGYYGGYSPYTAGRIEGSRGQWSEHARRDRWERKDHGRRGEERSR